MDFVAFGQSLSSCFSLLTAFVLSYANQLLAVDSYLLHRHGSSIDFVIYLLGKKSNKHIYQTVQ